MSTPFFNDQDHRPAFDKLLDPENFDESGNFKKPEGEPDSAPPDQAAKPADTAENTAATQPPPDATTAKPPDKATTTEDKSGVAAAPGTGTDQGKAAPAPAKTDEPTTDDETEDALKARLSKPTDTGDEWRIRALREGHALRKKLTPIQTHLDRINSTERASRGLEFTAVIGEPDEPIANAAQKLTELAPTRAVELRDFFYQETMAQWPDNVASDLVGEETTVAELKEALQLKRSGAAPAKETQPQAATATREVPKPEGMSDDDWSTFKEDYPEVYAAMEKDAAAKATPVNGKDSTTPAEDPRIAQLQQQLDELRGERTKQHLDQFVQEVQLEGQKLEAEVFSVVEDRLAELGLDPDTAKDDPATVQLKKTTLDDIRKQVVADFEGPNGPGGWDDWSQCNDEQKENRKLEKKVMELLARKDKSAYDYVDQLKARVEITLDRVVEAQLKRYNAAMLQPAEKPRNAGQEKHQRPDIVDGTAGTGSDTDKTPWLNSNFRLPGEDSFAAMNRWMAANKSMPGR